MAYVLFFIYPFEAKKMIVRKNFYSLAILLLFIALPMAYMHISDIRILPILVLVSFVCVVIGGIRLNFTTETCLYLLLSCYCFLVSSLSLNYSIFGATVIFFWLAYWPLYMKKSILISLNPQKILASFVLIGFFCALGIFLQIILFKFVNIEFGKIDLDGGGRQAFGFLWADYSFLSLFFASLVPLVWITSKSITWRIILSLSFILASVLTSARTGIISLGAAIAIGLLLEVLHSAIVGKMKKGVVILLVFIVVILPFFMIWLLEKFPRIASLNDSGRIDGFKTAFNFLQENFLFGAAFDTQFYKENIDVIPHNMFIYVTTIGGTLFLALFIFWALALTLRIIDLRERCLILSFMVSLIGFQFIPSFFSAYYFAIFIAICLMISIKNYSLIQKKV